MSCPRTHHLNNVPRLRGEKHDISLAGFETARQTATLAERHALTIASCPSLNDMPDCTEHSILSLFADDAKCSRIINNIEDCEQLQGDLNSLYEWSQVWKLNFNVLRCKVLSFTRNVTPIVFK